MNVAAFHQKALLEPLESHPPFAMPRNLEFRFLRESALILGPQWNDMRAKRAQISPADSAQRFSDLGVDVYFGKGSFVDNETVRSRAAMGW